MSMYNKDIIIIRFSHRTFIQGIIIIVVFVCIECYVRCQGAVFDHSESQQTMRVIKQSEWGALSWFNYVIFIQRVFGGHRLYDRS